VVYEKNRMPQTLKALMGTLDPRCRWVEVNATENKQTRAEPVSALYAQGKVHHVRDPRDPQKLARLEDEMIAWDPKLRMPSPNRMDALVWLIWALLLQEKRQAVRLL
jgi:phage terminase large subunit-like protein